MPLLRAVPVVLSAGERTGTVFAATPATTGIGAHEHADRKLAELPQAA